MEENGEKNQQKSRLQKNQQFRKTVLLFQPGKDCQSAYIFKLL